jgi:ankyrin repeat protein
LAQLYLCWHQLVSFLLNPSPSGALLLLGAVAYASDMGIASSRNSGFAAAASGDIKGVERVLEVRKGATSKANANVDSIDSSGRTMLISAVMNEHVEVAKLLLSRGADVLIEDELQYSALHYAASVGNTELTSLLLEKGADVDQATLPDRWTPLHCKCLLRAATICLVTLQIYC